MLLYKNEKGEIHTASRGGEHYDYSTRHITEHPLMIKLFEKYPQLILDGELYKHGKSLQQISGAARMEKNAYDMDWLQYYVYDIVEPTLEFKDRLKWLEVIQKELNLGEFNPDKEYVEGELQVQMVPQQPIKGWDNIKALHDKFVSEGWEGCVIRDPDKVYRPNGRTNDMIKIKCYQDAEFVITGLSEGLREEDMCFTLVTEDGISFKAKPMGSRDIKRQYRENLDKLIGKKATVKFFYLSDDGTPLQPVLKAIRDYE
jgi:ATP-dependent DNA ligase